MLILPECHFQIFGVTQTEETPPAPASQMFPAPAAGWQAICSLGHIESPIERGSWQRCRPSVTPSPTARDPCQSAD